MNIALIVFAGTGSRINSKIPKQFIQINETELIVYTIKKFEDNPHIDEIVLVTSQDFMQYTESLVDEYQFSKVKKIEVGGASRQESVRLGLESCNYHEDDNILIHDGDRPLVSNSIINQCLEYLDESQAVCPFIYEADRIEEISNSGRNIVLDNRSVDIQTPQGFKFGLIKEAHLNNKDKVFSDDISLVENVVRVKYFQGEKENFKVTTNKDLEYLEKLLNS